MLFDCYSTDRNEKSAEGIVPTSSGPHKPHYNETHPKHTPPRFNPFKFTFAIRSQEAQWQVTLVSVEHWQWELGVHSTPQERAPEEVVTLHYSVAKML